jgi:glucuronokinase
MGFTFSDFQAEATVEREARTSRSADRVAAAALATLAEHVGDPEVADLGVSCTTTIPREVGLGGSSALAVATLRAAGRALGRRLEPGELAQIALRAETERLGIAAGPQDRVVQAHGGLLVMDFANGRIERLDPRLLPPLVIAWRLASSADSGETHAGARARYDRGDLAMRRAMEEIAELARQGMKALCSRDHERFGELMRRNLELRGEVYDLDSRHLRMVEIASAHGVAANYTGSGGAIVGVAPPEGVDELRAALEREGCRLISPDIEGSPSGPPPL